MQSTISGRTIKLGFYGEPQNIDCTMQVGNKITVSAQLEPQHGRIWAQPTQGHPRYMQDSQLYKCDARTTDGLDLSYIPDDGFVGVDHAGYTIVATAGFKYVVDLTVNVYP